MPKAGTKSRYFKVAMPFRRKATYEEFKANNPSVTQEWGELEQMVKDIFDTASDMLVSNEDGLVMDGIGYFAGTAYSKRRKVVPGNTKTHMNFSAPYSYRMMMFPGIFYLQHLKFWSFKIHRDKARSIPEKIEEGVRYKNHYHFLKSLKNHGRKYFLRVNNSRGVIR